MSPIKRLAEAPSVCCSLKAAVLTVILIFFLVFGGRIQLSPRIVTENFLTSSPTDEDINNHQITTQSAG